MSHFLVTFHRRRVAPPHVERIEDPDEAISRLFESEKRLRNDPDRDVVMLVADSEDELRRTHAHYFKSFDELMELARG
jgi:hypothetical protein